MNEIFNPYEAIFQRLGNIEVLLNQRPEIDVATAYLPIQKAADFLGKTPNALRVMVHKNQIPHIKKQSKLFFRNTDLVKWLESGSIEYPQVQAVDILLTKKRKGLLK